MPVALSPLSVEDWGGQEDRRIHDREGEGETIMKTEQGKPHTQSKESKDWLWISPYRDGTHLKLRAAGAMLSATIMSAVAQSQHCKFGLGTNSEAINLKSLPVSSLLSPTPSFWDLFLVTSLAMCLPNRWNREQVPPRGGDYNRH